MSNHTLWMVLYYGGEVSLSYQLGWVRLELQAPSRPMAGWSWRLFLYLPEAMGGSSCPSFRSTLEESYWELHLIELFQALELGSIWQLHSEENIKGPYRVVFTSPPPDAARYLL